MNINQNESKTENRKEDGGNIWNLLNEFHGIKKVAMAPFVGILYVSQETLKISEKVKIGDSSLFERWVKMNENAEKEKEEHPIKWAAKKVAWGTVKGLFGAYK